MLKLQLQLRRPYLHFIRIPEVHINFISRLIPVTGKDELEKLVRPWVFIGRLVEHCSANTEAIRSNPVEALKFLFWAKINCLTSSLFEIDFEIKTNAKKSQRFDLSEVIFK